MNAWMLVLLAWIGPEPPVVRETVAQIEYSRVYDQRGDLTFAQIIYRDWHHGGELRIVDWRLVNCKGIAPVNGRCIWWDGDVLRDVRAVSVKDSYDQHDPEMTERKWLPQEQRRKFRKR